MRLSTVLQAGPAPSSTNLIRSEGMQSVRRRLRSILSVGDVVEERSLETPFEGDNSRCSSAGTVVSRYEVVFGALSMSWFGSALRAAPVGHLCRSNPAGKYAKL